MKKNWKLEDIAMRSIEVFSHDIAVKEAKKALGIAYLEWRLENLGEPLNFSKKDRKHLEEGMKEWAEMFEATKTQFDTLKDAIRARTNARKRLNHAITQILINQ